MRRATTVSRQDKGPKWYYARRAAFGLDFINGADDRPKLPVVHFANRFVPQQVGGVVALQRFSGLRRLDMPLR